MKMIKIFIPIIFFVLMFISHGYCQLAQGRLDSNLYVVSQGLPGKLVLYAITQEQKSKIKDIKVGAICDRLKIDSIFVYLKEQTGHEYKKKIYLQVNPELRFGQLRIIVDTLAKYQIIIPDELNSLMLLLVEYDSSQKWGTFIVAFDQNGVKMDLYSQYAKDFSSSARSTSLNKAASLAAQRFVELVKK